MTWNYRVVRYNKTGEYALHEVFYDADGKENAMSEEPAAFIGESPEDVFEALTMALASVQKHPVFDVPETWAGTGE